MTDEEIKNLVISIYKEACSPSADSSQRIRNIAAKILAGIEQGERDQAAIEAEFARQLELAPPGNGGADGVVGD
jgi:hypothetical protein